MRNILSPCLIPSLLLAKYCSCILAICSRSWVRYLLARMISTAIYTTTTANGLRPAAYHVVVSLLLAEAHHIVIDTNISTPAPSSNKSCFIFYIKYTQQAARKHFGFSSRFDFGFMVSYFSMMGGSAVIMLFVVFLFILQYNLSETRQLEEAKMKNQTNRNNIQRY